MPGLENTAEAKRLAACRGVLNECRTEKDSWKKWGPYLSERQGGTVREDYSDNGAGLGADQQTGWTGLVAKLIELFGSLDQKEYFLAGKRGAFRGREKR